LITAELADSGTLTGDPRALRSLFQADGCLFLRRLLSPPTVHRLADRVLDAIGTHGWLGGPPRTEGDEAWWPGYAAIQALEEFHALAFDPALLGVMRALSGDDVMAHPRKIARVTYPESEHPTPAHQDFIHVQGTADTYTAWIPLRDCGAELGALRLARGSHRAGLRPVRSMDGVGGVGVDGDPATLDWLSAEYAVGDVVVFHSFTVHEAPPNRGDELRLSVDYRYQSRDDPIDAGSTLPHGYPAVPGWDELTRGWSTRRWIELPAPVEVTPTRDPLGGLGAPVSRHVG
jgi:hypothetical protein